MSISKRNKSCDELDAINDAGCCWESSAPSANASLRFVGSFFGVAVFFDGDFGLFLLSVVVPATISIV